MLAANERWRFIKGNAALERLITITCFCATVHKPVIDFSHLLVLPDESNSKHVKVNIVIAVEADMLV